jgi:diaminohydroxyphosphoribosylaminopyrimidine deaminase/5-amino-6-(5-phosphoribosylamino)uracil reductase
MNLAINEAWKYQGLTYPNPAVGAVVLGPQGQILSINAHREAGQPHAEVLALKDAYIKLTGDTAIVPLQASAAIHEYLIKRHNGCFYECSIYVTLEPCAHSGKTPSCARLLQSLSLRRVIIGMQDTHEIAAGGAAYCNSVDMGVCASECEKLLLPFLKWQERNFVYFKWAQRLDATVDGTTVSSLKSRTYVHALRNRCDLLVIGGNTLRTDRPTLDARLVNGKAPDVLIYSSHKTFDTSIPLFQVPNRKVYVESSLQRLGEYKNIMIEGGPSLFEAIQESVDCFLSFTAPSTGGTIPFCKTKSEFEYLHVEPFGDDLKMWLRKRDE